MFRSKVLQKSAALGLCALLAGGPQFASASLVSSPGNSQNRAVCNVKTLKGTYTSNALTSVDSAGNWVSYVATVAFDGQGNGVAEWYFTGRGGVKEMDVSTIVFPAGDTNPCHAVVSYSGQGCGFLAGSQPQRVFDYVVAPDGESYVFTLRSTTPPSTSQASARGERISKKRLITAPIPAPQQACP